MGVSLGWAQAMRPYAGERWSPLLLLVALATATVAAAFALSARRDVAAGFIRPRPGRANASALLTRPLGLAMRLQRGSLLAWAAGLFIGGLAGGGLAVEADAFTDALGEEFFPASGASLTDQLLAFFLLFMALLTAGAVLQSALRARGEEIAGRADPVLAAAVPRWQWVAGHLVVALAGGVFILTLVGVGAGLVYGADTGDAGEVPRLAGAALVHLPAIALLLAVAVLLFGFVPRAVGAVWVLLGYAAFIAMFAPLFQLPDWMHDLSPFDHIPAVPADDLAPTPLLVLTAIAVALIAAGLGAGADGRGVHRLTT